MLQKTTTLFILFFIPIFSFAQFPLKMNFQAVMRNANNTIISKSPIGIRISILSGSNSGQAVYAETQMVQSDINGLISLQIGSGIAEMGSLGLIDWSKGLYFIKTEADPSGGNNYSITGTSELLSVPYAMYALNGGKNGVDGTPGANGTNGINGTAGSKGIDGINGTAGTNGIDGINGTAGSKGIDGINGAAGTNGIDGINGAAGSKGIDGINGAAGTNGIDGINGTAGSKGIDGINAPNSEPLVSLGTVNQYYRGDKTWQSLNSSTVNLANVENTSDLHKVVSTDTQNALNLKSNLSSPQFTGTPLTPTAPLGTNSSQIASTEFVLANTNEAYSVMGENELITSSSADILVTGLSLSPAAGKYLVQYNAQFSIKPTSTLQTSIDLDDLYNTLQTKASTISSHSATYADENLLPGIYSNAGAVTANGTLTLDAQNNPNAEFIFRFSGAFSTGAGLTILLVNGASTCHIYWIATGAIALGANNTFHGTLIAKNGAITVGNNSTTNGGLFSTTGSIGIDNATVSTLVNCDNYSNSINKFGIFTSSGVITNVNQSILNGDIATHLGSISGFSTATINGLIYNPGIISTTASFSIYQNGTILPFTSRSVSADSNLSSTITLIANTTIAQNDSLDIRWKVGSGTVKMTNRILSALKIR